jgi:predicted dehydrogenase
VEKPLGMEFKELTNAVDVVKKSDRIVQSGSQMRRSPSAEAARSFVASGGLGKIIKIEQSRNAYRPYWHGLQGERTIAEADVDWRAFLMHRKYRPWDPEQYVGWYGYREFSRGPHAGFMSHFTDLLHFVTGAQYPWRAVALGGIFRWKDAHTAPDSIEVVLEYREGFLARYNTTFGTSANRFMRFIGARGMLDAQDWSKPWVLTGEAQASDRVPAGTVLPPAPGNLSVAQIQWGHLKNWFDCLRSRKQPIAPIEAGFGHSVACIMADEAFISGRRMVFDPVKRFIHEG